MSDQDINPDDLKDPDHVTYEKIRNFEEEVMKLAENQSNINAVLQNSPYLLEQQKENPETNSEISKLKEFKKDSEDNQIFNRKDFDEDEPNKKNESEEIYNQENDDLKESNSPLEKQEESDDQEQNKDNKVLKEYQNTLQELKEEISRLNKQLDHKSRQIKRDPTAEELFKIKSVCKHAKAEAKLIQNKYEELFELNFQTIERLESLKQEVSIKKVSTEKIESLKNTIKTLEQDYDDLKRPTEITIADLDRVLAPDATLKLVNEFYVNLQKRISYLDTENNALSADIKKSSNDLAKLKEKLENASARRKVNEDIKQKLMNLEETYKNYNETEAKIIANIKNSREEYSLFSSTPENQHDAESAKMILKDMKDQVLAEENELEKLEFILQEKRNMLRAAQVYGLQRSKTSTKLRTDMELLGLVLVEKEQMVSRLMKETHEFRIKTNQVQIDIKEIKDKKNSSYN